MTEDISRGRRIIRNRVIGGAVFVGVVAAWSFGPGIIEWFSRQTGVEEQGQLGDSYGLINALFSGLAFGGVVMALLYQSTELEFQYRELKNSVRALEGQAKTGTEMLEHHRKALDIEIDRAKRERTIQLFDFWMTELREDRRRAEGWIRGRSLHLDANLDSMLRRGIEPLSTQRVNHQPPKMTTGYDWNLRIILFFEQLSHLEYAGELDSTLLHLLMGVDMRWWLQHFIAPLLVLERDAAADHELVARLAILYGYLLHHLETTAPDEAKKIHSRMRDSS